MAVITPARGAQWPLVAEFTFNFDDTMLNTAGVSDGFATAAAHVFDCIKLPQGATVIGGGLFVETAFNTTTYAVIVGDATVTNRYLATADRKAVGYTALVPTEYVGIGEDIRLTITPTGSTATTGKATLRVLYTLRNRINENSPN